MRGFSAHQLQNQRINDYDKISVEPFYFDSTEWNYQQHSSLSWVLNQQYIAGWLVSYVAVAMLSGALKGFSLSSLFVPYLSDGKNSPTVLSGQIWSEQILLVIRDKIINYENSFQNGIIIIPSSKFLEAPR